jgi:hypothetical protein
LRLRDGLFDPLSSFVPVLSAPPPGGVFLWE